VCLCVCVCLGVLYEVVGAFRAMEQRYGGTEVGERVWDRKTGGATR